MDSKTPSSGRRGGRLGKTVEVQSAADEHGSAKGKAKGKTEDTKRVLEKREVHPSKVAEQRTAQPHANGGIAAEATGETPAARRRGRPSNSPTATPPSTASAATKKMNGRENGDLTSSPAAAAAPKASNGRQNGDSGAKGKRASKDPEQNYVDDQEDAQEKKKRLMIPQILLYDGSLFTCNDDLLLTKHITPLFQMLSEAGLDPKQALKGWTIRIKQRNAGQNIGNTDCEYFTTKSGEVFRSRIQIARHLGLAPPDPNKPAKPLSGEGKKRKGRNAHDEDDDVEESILNIDDEFRLPNWAATSDVASQAPSKRRQKLLNEHLLEMKGLMDRLFRIDEFGHFRGEAHRRRSGVALKPVDRANPTNLRDIRSKVWSHDYVVTGRDATVKWSELITDVETVVDLRLKELEAVTPFLEGVDADDHSNSNPTFCAERILDAARKKGQANDDMLKAALARIRTEEDYGWFDVPNTEPAMPRWRKELMKSYKYDQWQEYSPADGLLPEEKEQLLQKLVDTSHKGDRWVYQEGLEMVDLWAQVVALDRLDLPSERKPLPRLRDSLHNEEIVEQHTWGIDCFCRRNIEMILTRGRGEFSLTLPQIHFFIEMILLRAINAVRPIENAWDMRLALRDIIRQMADRKLQEPTLSDGTDAIPLDPLTDDDALASAGEAIPMSKRPKKVKTEAADEALWPRRSAREKEKAAAAAAALQKVNQLVLDQEDDAAAIELGPKLVHRRVKIYWPDDDQWYMGRIIGFKAPATFLVAYDDGHNIWEDLGKEKFKVLGAGAQKVVYDPSITDAQIQSACELLLDQYERRGETQFQIHSKGIGVVTKVDIQPGKLVQKYTGMLYPCWLWEEKEAKEDAERLEHKRATGEIVLPDFWNMRLELPKGEDEEGIDLLHVDAKTGGNFSSRMSHSCRPNCGAMTAVIDGKYCIGMRALRKIEAGEELTIDYNCVTDSMDEFRAAICLCGAHDCRGSFLYITGETHQMQVVDRSHGPLHRVAMLFSACYETGELERAFGRQCTRTWPRWIKPEERFALMYSKPITAKASKKKANSTNAGPAVKKKQVAKDKDDDTASDMETEVSRDDPIVMDVLKERGFGNRALISLPSWALRFAAHIVEFIECEEYELARIDYNKKDSKASLASADPDEKWRIAKLESKGIADQRVTNLLIALDKARHHMCERLTTSTTEGASQVDAERSRLRERWWLLDRCLARWVGDDADEYPDWYPAVVTHVYVKTQELRVVYDSSEVNRIPISMARRPKKAEIPPPYTGCDVSFHQPPFRVLDEDDVLFFLWTDKNSGIATRLVKSLLAAWEAEIPLWQTTHDPVSRTSYWWNFETREVRQVKPTNEQLQLKTRFEPKILGQIQRMLTTDKQPTTGEAARKALMALRDLVLKIPVVGSNRFLEDMHQKAADLLTLYSLTRNFFVLNEPETESGNTHAVINALTSWIGQGVESRVPDVTDMIGSALLPAIERAYDPNCGLGYCGSLRGTLLAHLRHNGMSTWPENVVSAFPSASDLPPQPPEMEKQWPHPVPPVRLFGTPALDSAIFHHLDFTRSCALAREAPSMETESRQPVLLEEDRGQKNLVSVAQTLREKKRDSSKLDAEDLAKISPPKLPEPSSYTWVQCEGAACGKWRKLPFGVDAKKLPSPFYCSQLVDIDAAHADCSVAEEQEQGTISWEAKPVLDPDQLKVDDVIDAFDGAEWKIASVVEVSGDAVKIKYLDHSKLEWVAKHPEVPMYAFPALAVLHTYTPTAQFRKVRANVVPYQGICADAHPDVARCLAQMVATVEKKLLKERPGAAVGAKVAARMHFQTLFPSSAAVRPGRTRKSSDALERLQEVGFSGDMNKLTKVAFSNYFVHERTNDPLVPFVTVLARWHLLDQSQREVWQNRMARSFAAAPPENERFVGPSFLSSGKNQTVELTRRFLPDRSTRTFFGELDQIVVGLPLDTDYGKGVVTEVDDHRACVRLVWGAKAYLPLSELKIYAPLFSACPRPAVMGEEASGRNRRARVRDEDGDDEFVGTTGRIGKRLRRSDADVAKRLAETKLAIVESDPHDHPAKKYKPVDPAWFDIREDVEGWRPQWMHLLLEECTIGQGVDIDEDDEAGEEVD